MLFFGVNSRMGGTLSQHLRLSAGQDDMMTAWVKVSLMSLTA
jgi:hypothetical protein